MKEQWKETWKLPTGNEGFDNLLFGGFGFSSQVLVSGPPFIGKEVFINMFIAGGLKVGAPMTVVLMDRSPAQQREELKLINSDIEGYEKDGLLKFIDAYSKPVGLKNIEEGQNIIHIADNTDLHAVIEAVRKADRPYMQLVVRSVSDCLCYSGLTDSLGFLRSVTGRGREEKRVCLYDMNRPAHTEQEFNNVVRLMDDVVEFRREGAKNSVRVTGRSSVVRSDWVEYKFTAHELKLGSLTVGHVGQIG